MSQLLDTIRHQFSQLSRAMQWAVYSAAGIGLFLAWDSFVSPVAVEWRSEADRLQADLDKVRSSRKTGEELKKRASADLVLAYGAVELPRNEAEARNALVETVNHIVDEHSVKEYSFDQRGGGKLPKAALPGLTGGKRVARLQGDLRFESSTKDATAIIAELEASPAIESVSSINLTKGNPGRIKVRLTLETWAVSAGAGS